MEREMILYVIGLCEKVGYGRVMEIAATAWHQKDPAGALTIGPACGLPPTATSERTTLVTEVGECCTGSDPLCAGGCLVEKALRRRSLTGARIRRVDGPGMLYACGCEVTPQYIQHAH